MNSYNTINIRVKSITPNDKFSTVGKEGFIYKAGLNIDEGLVIQFGDNGYLKTSRVQSIAETAKEIEVKTLNSVYVLEKI